jgi:two-component system, sensor histidine kinase YesM
MFGRILTSQLILILLPVALIGLLSFYASERIINRQLIRINTAALNQVEENLKFLTGNIYHLATLYLFDSEIENSLKDEVSDPLQWLYRQRLIENKISNYSLPFDQLRTHTLILSNQGMRFTATHDFSEITFNDITKTNWYQKLRIAPHHQLWFTTNPGFTSIPKHTSVLTFAYIMEDQQFNRQYGIILFSLEESLLYDIYKNVLDTGSQLYITNGQGQILSHSRREMTGQTIPRVKLNNLISHCSPTSETGIFYQGHLITLIKKVRNLDWYIVYSIPEAVNFHSLRDLRQEIIFIALLCLLLSFSLAFFIARYFSTPLIRLTQRVSAYLTSVSQTENIKAEPFEIDLLSSEYEMLISRLDNTIQQLVKEQEEKRKTEFHVLQMQINPHFLYNTLNSIKCLVWTHRIDLIEPTLTALIKLFRQMANMQDDIITIAEEIENIRNYIFIHQIRTGTSIELNCHISNKLKNCKIPKLILQPIVENAIFHGIEPKNGSGTISLHCTSSKGRIIIEIRDNGIGMDDVAIAKICSDEHPSNKNSFNGIGIKNINQRIKLLYGAECGLTIKSEPGIGTLVTVTLLEIH